MPNYFTLTRLTELAVRYAHEKWHSYQEIVPLDTYPIFLRSAAIDVLRRDLEQVVLQAKERLISQERAEGLVDSVYPLGRETLLRRLSWRPKAY